MPGCSLFQTTTGEAGCTRVVYTGGSVFIDPRSGILGQSECVFVILKDTAELPYTEVKRELYNLKS